MTREVENTFFDLAVVKNRSGFLMEFGRYLLYTFGDICISCLGRHIAISSCRSLSKSLFELAVVDSVPFAVGKQHKCRFFVKTYHT